MRINVYRYTDTHVAVLVTTLEVISFPSDQTCFATTHGGDFIEVEEQEDVLHWPGSLQADREGHIRQLLAEGIEAARCDS